MKRRQFMTRSAGIGAAVVALPLSKNLKAHDQTAKLELSTQISRNHGHDLELHLDDVILLLRKAKEENEVALDIKGTSPHPHTIKLTESDILELLVDGETLVRSSVDAGHAHNVTIFLEEL